MEFRCVRVAAALSIATIGGAVSAQTISSGDVFFTLGAAPTSPEAMAAPTADFRVSGPAGVDHLASTWWWYRTASQTREFAFNTPTSSVFAGDTATLTFAVADQNFTATLVYRVLDLPGPDTGVLLESMTIFNTSPTTNLNIDLTLFRDIDLAGTPANDTVSAAGVSAPNVLQITDGLWRDYSEGSGRYNVQNPPGVLNLLTNPLVDTFLPTTIPSTPGSYQHGFQWTLNLLPFSAATLTASETITRIPSPGAAVVLGAGLLASAGRRRRM